MQATDLQQLQPDAGQSGMSERKPIDCTAREPERPELEIALTPPASFA